MDIGNTVSKVRKEYKEYLSEKHPDWAESTVRTHVSDAFYLYQNTIALSFWKCFADDASMAAAKEDIRNYLVQEIMSDRADERTTSYYHDLSMLKEFIDSKGGVRAYIGYEYDCEITVYNYCKKAYDGEMPIQDAIAALLKEVPCFGETSYKSVYMVFEAMMEGRKYSWKANTETTIYFITHIGMDYGKEKMIAALKATQENIKYYYEQTGNKSASVRRGCMKVVKDHNLDIPFDESIFEGIIPKQTTDAALSSDEAAVRYWLYAAGDLSLIHI